MKEFIAKELLDELSYCSSLKGSLKQISLRKTPIELILEDIGVYRNSFVNIVAQENLIDYRFKSDDSIMRKYEKTLKTGGGFRQCFNDVLGFRLWFEKYPEEFPEHFRVVDLRNGKRIDDGYRAIHLYYQRDNKAYPIEIQLWCEPDHTFNVWSHRHIYKYKDPEIGKMLHDEYLIGKLKNEDDFLLRLKEMEG